MDNNKIYQTYVSILKEELIPAMGCTEPIAVSYCASQARDILGMIPERVEVHVSGNIIKNVKSVIVPHTGGLKGIEAAVAAGIIAGDCEKELEVISLVQEEQYSQIKDYMNRDIIHVFPLDTENLLEIIIEVFKDNHQAKVRIVNLHTNIVSIEKDHQEVFSKNECHRDKKKLDYSLLNVQDIYHFAQIVDMNDIQDTIKRQIDYNSAIAKRGLDESYGANIGSVILEMEDKNIKNRAKAYAAAGSDARMSGCELPVIINSGSGNQGMTVSLPVLEYAKELDVSEEQLYRALVLSNLLAIHQKTGIGRLSAYCGAVSAGAAAGCGIAYLHGGDYKCICHTLVNSLAITSGIICDGAKASCAAKIAASVDAGILGYQMYLKGQQFKDGDGIVTKGVENTIKNIYRLGHDGMKETDKEILRIMTGC